MQSTPSAGAFIRLLSSRNCSSNRFMCGLSFSSMLRMSLPCRLSGSRFPSIRSNFSGFRRVSGGDRNKAQFFSFGCKQRQEHLFVERVLEFVVLNEIVGLASVGDVITQVVIPIHILLVHHVVKETLVNIEFAVIVADKEQCLERCSLVARVGRCGVAIDHGHVPHVSSLNTSPSESGLL